MNAAMSERRILIVEDRTNIRSLIKAGLSSLPCTFDEAATWSQARRLLAERTFDLILLDLGLPDVADPDKLLDDVTRCCAPARVVLMTAQGGASIRKACEEKRVDACFAKPFDIHELNAAVRHMLGLVEAH